MRTAAGKVQQARNTECREGKRGERKVTSAPYLGSGHTSKLLCLCKNVFARSCHCCQWWYVATVFLQILEPQPGVQAWSRLRFLLGILVATVHGFSLHVILIGTWTSLGWVGHGRWGSNVCKIIKEMGQVHWLLCSAGVPGTRKTWKY